MFYILTSVAFAEARPTDVVSIIKVSMIKPIIKTELTRGSGHHGSLHRGNLHRDSLHHLQRDQHRAASSTRPRDKDLLTELEVDRLMWAAPSRSAGGCGCLEFRSDSVPVFQKAWWHFCPHEN